MPRDKPIEWIEMCAQQRPTAHLDAASPRKNIDFVDFDSLELQGYGIAAPGGAETPGLGDGTDGNTGIKRGYGASAAGQRTHYFRRVRRPEAGKGRGHGHAIF